MNWRFISYFGFGLPSFLSLVFAIDLLEALERPIPRYAGMAFIILSMFLLFICFRFKDDKRWAISALISSLVSLPTATFMMFAAWEHNHGQEFHNLNGIEWINWVSIGSSWFIAVYIFILPISRFFLKDRFRG